MPEEILYVQFLHKVSKLLVALLVTEDSHEVMGLVRKCLSTLCWRFENVPLVLVLHEIDLNVVRLEEVVGGVHRISSMFLSCSLFFCNSYTTNSP